MWKCATTLAGTIPATASAPPLRPAGDQHTGLVPSLACTRPDPMPRVLSRREHIADLVSIAGPIITSQILTISMTLVDFAMVGRLGKTELAAASLATTWFNLLNHPVTGGLSALDTFFSQSFGARDYPSVSRWLRAGAAATVAVTLPQAALVALCSPALRALGQERALADLAAGFCYRLIPGLVPYYLFQLLTKYLQCNGILKPSIYIAFVANVLNIITNYIFIYSFGLGLNGAAVSTTIMRWLQFLLLLVYIVRYLKGRTPSIQASWPTTISSWYNIVRSGGESDNSPLLPFSSPSSSSSSPSDAPITTATFKIFLKLAIPGMCMLATEAWAFEISTILAGLLHSLVSLDAHSALLTTCAFAFLSVPFAIGVAGCIRTGTFLGCSDARNAKGGAEALLLLTTGTQCFVAFLFFTCRRPVSFLFTDDVDVAEAVARLCSLAALFQVSDGLQSSVGGVLRGVGKHHIVLGMNVVGFWLLGVPMMLALTFGAKNGGGKYGHGADLGVAGIWWGFVGGLTTTALGGVFYVTKVLDFQREVDVAKGIQQETVEPVSVVVSGGGDGDEFEPVRKKGGARVLDWNNNDDYDNEGPDSLALEPSSNWREERKNKLGQKSRQNTIIYDAFVPIKAVSQKKAAAKSAKRPAGKAPGKPKAPPTMPAIERRHSAPATLGADEDGPLSPSCIEIAELQARISTADSDQMAPPDQAQVRSLPGNDSCCDCGQASPDWASVSFGILLCLDCSGRHRGLGTHISFVRSMTMDSWSPAQLALMLNSSNARVNAALSYDVPSAKPPSSALLAKYSSNPALLYRTQLNARAEGRPEPTVIDEALSPKPKLSREELQARIRGKNAVGSAPDLAGLSGGGNVGGQTPSKGGRKSSLELLQAQQLLKGTEMLKQQLKQLTQSGAKKAGAAAARSSPVAAAAEREADFGGARVVSTGSARGKGKSGDDDSDEEFEVAPSPSEWRKKNLGRGGRR